MRKIYIYISILQNLMENALVNHPQFCEIKNVNELTLGGN